MLVEPLSDEDLAVQSMPDASPAKWHLAHTTWFFETFVLAEAEAGYRPYRDDFAFLFNSYYQGVGPMHERPARGMITRPSAGEVMAYRDVVDERMVALLERGYDRLAPVIETGLHHEMQHQELILSDIKHLLSMNPLSPAYRDEGWAVSAETPPAARWVRHGGGLVEIGADGPAFSFDNERPRHRAWLEPYEVGDRLVTNGEYLAFIEDGGYDRHELWLDEGWHTARSGGWRAPLYWRERQGAWREFTLHGEHALDPGRPVLHVSLFEADAYARWAGARLLTEAEWEGAFRDAPIGGVESGAFHTSPDLGDARLRGSIGQAWEWTGSQYRPYPGFRPQGGALGEYNGKFMSSQFVLRGGSFVSPRASLRPTYRNFFQPEKRWQFSGIRLGRDA